MATELGSSVIYCHHHSKGGQGNKKSMDRASGSGVFARDPDALIDLIELELSEEMIQAEENRIVCQVYQEVLMAHNRAYYQQNVTPSDLERPAKMKKHAREAFGNQLYYDTLDQAKSVKKLVQGLSLIHISEPTRRPG